MQEVLLSDGAVMLTRYGDNICIADHRQYSVFANANGDPIRGTIQWPSLPKALCVEFPYLAALLRNNTIEVHNIVNQEQLQVITLDAEFEAQGMAFGHGIKVWMEGLSRRLRRCVWSEVEVTDEEIQEMLRREASRYSSVSARILIYGKDSVTAQVVTPLIVQTDNLLDSGHVEEATEMAYRAQATISPDYNANTKRLQSELYYIYQKAGLLLLKETLFEDAFPLLGKGEMDPRLVIHLFGDLKQPKWLQEYPPVLLFEGIQRLFRQLGYIEDIVASSTERTYGSQPEDAQKLSPVMELRRALLNNARAALQNYLLEERKKYSDKRGKGNSICKAIDTSLLKLYITHKEDDLIYQFLKEPNDCCPEECAHALFQYKKYYALSIFYGSKNMYEKVLKTWTGIYSGELEDPEFKDGLKHIKELLLRDISDHELPLATIMQYAWWLTDQTPSDGVDIFVRSPRRTDMDSDEILEKLQAYGDEPVLTYLEYLVLERKSERVEYHTRLACGYAHNVRRELDNGQLEQMEELVERYKLSLKAAETEDWTQVKNTFVEFLGSQPPTSVVKHRLSLIRMLSRSQLYSAEEVFEVLPKAGPLNVELVILYGRMGMHEQALHILIHDLGDFVGAETYCVTNGQSTGIVPQFEESQTISSGGTPVLNGLEKSEIQTDSVEGFGPEQLNERRRLFSMLLKTYLAISESQLMVKRTMHLLDTQGIYLDALEVLELIPENWPIEMLQHFLIGALRRSLHEYQESQVVLGMSRGENVMVGSELIEVYQDIGAIYVDSQSICPRCQQYLGDSMFVRDQDGRLFHLHCAKALSLVNNK
ncbi:transforming growth factor, beta receptor associated protein 1 [Apophysomyces ossiformis]|uniref:Transforming growth factor, beta receptor associated protein 1 n=1 Tax=Apophysomyces ossiformis TaxID=679940 RepID=A0A8H7BRG0_9FUNG|nr:transforming growth factor, beta receptor associated protein 1 [Apophysomyces ossiformis]